ncbi:hypothetical protein HPB50_015450 [Hyalomma asiaticum]|uniref:Uncharacterized protein n=1 Tax=Hyalomma asiaticum TaxID=266040 RepID=A0ACB7TA84_HYAAI|nr:hypothetical protein HPB50_015450 [Hyalomma asiaticum]
MAKHTLAVLILLAFSVSVASGLSNPVPAYLPAPKKCGRNEFYKACVSSNCAENLCGEATPKACVEDCVSGCYCAHDHYRNRLGLCVTDCERNDGGLTMKSVVVVALLAAFLVECVLASQTRDPNWRPPKPRKCGPGEVWKECVSRGCGEKTCPPKEFQGCLSTCEFGCYCADGFFRNPQGRCVRGCSGQSSPVIGKPAPSPDTPFYPPQRPVQHPGLGSQIGPYPARPFPPHTRPQVYPGIFPGHLPHGLPYRKHQPNLNAEWNQQRVIID